MNQYQHLTYLNQTEWVREARQNSCVVIYSAVFNASPLSSDMSGHPLSYKQHNIYCYIINI